VRIARRGLLNVLRHVGIVDGAVEKRPTRWLDMPTGDCFAFAEDDGMIEAMVDLGEPVKEGAVVARIYSTGRTGQAP
jgi:N2-acetyl-L-2,4-diaminobutanoate deacetylase